MIVTLYRDFTFEAAHRNLSAAKSEACSRLHGHSYRVRVRLSGPVDPKLGWLMDFGDIKKICAPVVEQLDHQNLNDIEGMGSVSLTDVQSWIDSRLRATIRAFAACEVSIIGPTSLEPIVQQGGDPSPLQACVVFGFAAAHYLPNLPEGHRCRRLHGHSFRLEVTAPCSVQQALMKSLGEIYPRVDHRLLNEIEGLENPTSEHLAQWLWRQLDRRGSKPTEILVQEACTSGCIFHGEN